MRIIRFCSEKCALRLAASQNVPVVFTHHTMYERDTHYVPGDSPALRRFAVQLTTDFANLCDRVFAPSESVASILRDRGVIAPLDIVPTGVDTARFSQGDGQVLRRELGIPDHAFVVGHIGRLAPEKNLDFLADAVRDSFAVAQTLISSSLARVRRKNRSGGTSNAIAYSIGCILRVAGPARN